MYCRKCGSEINEHDSFCPHCGADQSGDNTIVYSMILKAFAFICALIFLICALGNISDAFELFSLLIWDFFNIVILVVINLLSAVVGVWMVFILVLFALRRTEENTPALTLGLFVGGVAAVALRIVQVPFATFYYYNDFAVSTSILGVLACLGGVYGLLYMMGQAPKPETLLQDTDRKFAEILAIVEGFSKKDTYNASTDDYDLPNDYSDDHGDYYGGDSGNDNGTKHRIKTNRSILKYIVFSICTCGIYGWYFIYCMARDVNIMCKDDGEKTGGLLAYIVLNIITCGFYNLYWIYRVGNRLANNARRYNLNFQENGTTLLVWYVVGLIACGIGSFVAIHILIKNTNALAHAYNEYDAY